MDMSEDLGSNMPTYYQAYLSVKQLPPGVAVCGVVFGIICIMSAIFGNVLIIATVLKERSLRQRQNVFVISMAVSELFVIFIRDIFVLGVYCRREWVFGSTLVSAGIIINICRNAVAVGHIVAITIYRYALIVHNKAYHVITKTPFLVFVLLLLFFFPLGAAIATANAHEMYTYNTKSMWPIKESDLKIIIFSYNTNSSNFTSQKRVSSLAIVFGYLLINVAILALCYIHIYIFIKRSAQRVKNWSSEATHRQPNATKAGRCKLEQQK